MPSSTIAAAAPNDNNNKSNTPVTSLPSSSSSGLYLRTINTTSKEKNGERPLLSSQNHLSSSSPKQPKTKLKSSHFIAIISTMIGFILLLFMFLVVKVTKSMTPIIQQQPVLQTSAAFQHQQQPTHQENGGLRMTQSINNKNSDETIQNIAITKTGSDNKSSSNNNNKVEDVKTRNISVNATTSSPPVTATATRTTTTPSAPFFRVIQVSKHHTGSTMMANLLVGLFEEDGVNRDACYLPLNVRLNANNKDPCPNNVVVKTHLENVAKLQRWFSNQSPSTLLPQQQQRIYFVSTSRKEKNLSIAAKYCLEAENVLCLEYSDLLYDANDEKDIRRVVEFVVKEIQTKLFPSIPPEKFNSVESVITRLQDMDRVQQSLAQESFDVQNVKYLIHGGHRNRKEAVPK